MNDAMVFGIQVASIFFAAGLIKGLLGLGLPTLALALLSFIMAPVAAATMLLIPSFATNIWQALHGSSLLALLQRFKLMFIAVAAGTLLCSALLVQIDPTWTRQIVGAVLIVYAIYAILSPTIRIPMCQEKLLSPIIGAMTGAVAGNTGISVVPVVPYLQALRLNKQELVQAMGLSFSISTIALGLGLGVHGQLETQHLLNTSMCLIPAMIGMGVGQRIRNRISQEHLKRGLWCFLALLGLEMVLRPLL